MLTTDAPVKLSPNESMKSARPRLDGTIAQVLADPQADHFAEEDIQFLKFHGIYQQDDRDLRKTGKKYIFMVRGRLPGGVVSPEQYLTFDRLATVYGNNTLRITSRQGFQFHGVVKNGLRPLIKGINDSLSTTLAACGDVNRNVMAPPGCMSSVASRVLEDARLLSDALLPRTSAYHEIWLEGVEVTPTDEEPGLGNRPEESDAQTALSAPHSGNGTDFVDPLYGRQYLPRKFKIAFAIPPRNDIDVYTNCLGFVAIAQEGVLEGYNLLAGGGLGMSHGNVQTFPRLADLIGFFRPEQILAVATAVLTIHRDFGDRANRKHARLKYVLEDRGVAWFREEVERRIGFKLDPPRPFQMTEHSDAFGWHRQEDGKYFAGLYVETGRIKDTPSLPLKTVLREIVEEFQPGIRLTPSQNLLLVDLSEEQREAITRKLARHGINLEDQASLLRRASMACPSLPTCGLGLAESERFLPGLLDQLEGLLKELNLQEQEIIVRMTGCPNGCARPYMAEIGMVGKAPNKYQIYFGGNASNTRLNRLYQESVPGHSLIEVLRPVLTRYAQERGHQERFGDWCQRVLWAESRPAA